MLEKEKAAIHKYLTDNEITTVLDEDDLVHHAYMLTQYEKYGEVDLGALYNYIADEIMDDPTIWQVNDYLVANAYYEDRLYTYDEFEEEELQHWKPMDIVSATLYGEVDFSKPYFTLNGSGNIASVSDSEVQKMYGKNTKIYLIERGEVDGDAGDILDDAEEIIKIANYLVREGW